MARKITVSPPPNNVNSTRIDFNPNGFEKLVYSKGYEVMWEKALQCPCKNKGGEAQVDCKNCNGTGWIFINQKKTRMVIQSQEFKTIFRDWGEETAGTAKLTSLPSDPVSFMDRITIQNATSYFSNVLYPILDTERNLYKAFTFYNVEEIEHAFLFNDVNQPLIQLNVDDIIIEAGEIYFPQNLSQYGENLQISIRYSHKPVYHVIDINRELIESFVKNNVTGIENSEMLPINGLCRRAHYLTSRFKPTFFNDSTS